MFFKVIEKETFQIDREGINFMKKSFLTRAKASVSALLLAVMVLAFPLAVSANGPFDTVPVDMSKVVYELTDVKGVGKLKFPNTFRIVDSYDEPDYFYTVHEDLASDLVGYRVMFLEYLRGAKVNLEIAAKELYYSLQEGLYGYVSNPYYCEPTLIKCGDQDVWIFSVWYFIQFQYEYYSWVFVDGPDGTCMILIQDTVPQVSEVKEVYDEFIDSFLALTNPSNVGNKAYSRYLDTFLLW